MLVFLSFFLPLGVGGWLRFVIVALPRLFYFFFELRLLISDIIINDRLDLRVKIYTEGNDVIILFYV